MCGCGLLQESSVAICKDHSRVRHFGGVFDFPYKWCMACADMRWHASVTLGIYDISLCYALDHPMTHRMARVRAPSVRIPTCSSCPQQWRRRSIGALRTAAARGPSAVSLRTSHTCSSLADLVACTADPFCMCLLVAQAAFNKCYSRVPHYAEVFAFAGER